MKYIITETQKENLRDFIKDKIENGDLIEIAKYMGGYNVIKNIMGEDEISKDDKIYSIIKNLEPTLNTFFLRGEHKIEFGLPQHCLKYVIYSINPKTVGIEEYGNWGEILFDRYHITYEKLPSDVLDKIIDILIE
jgi:hypothetical protein